MQITGSAPLVYLGYQRLTVDNVTPQTATVPPGTNFITFTAEDNPVRWIGPPNVASLLAGVGNPLPVSWATAFFEMTLQTNSAPSFISQSGTAKVNINYWQ